jgi:hypothetical protein
MTGDRRCFLQHFVICLAVCAAGFFAIDYHLPQMIWNGDVSMMTSLIAALFIVSSLYLGSLCWQLSRATAFSIEKKAEFGWFAAETCVQLALVGTTIGLIMQARTLMSGTAGLLPLSTSLLTTAVGISASIILRVMAYNLNSGIDRLRE